ncbi:MAG: hypothetical protein M1431_02040 [Candidatus Thermoplasmatota archaeon]|nr:hypothetical protein [Candidatus Thermoplasmatota archaeon]
MMEPRPSFDNLRKHVISFETAKGLTWEIVMSYVKPEMATPLSDLTLNDLAIYPGVGLYFFYDKSNNLQYVGKCTSRSFIERVPSHFDCRKHAQFATVAKRRGGENSPTDDISEISRDALKDLKLFLVNFTYDEKSWSNGNYSKDNIEFETGCEAKFVGYLESSIIYSKKPCLNRPRITPVKNVEC